MKDDQSRKDDYRFAGFFHLLGVVVLSVSIAYATQGWVGGLLFAAWCLVLAYRSERKASAGERQP